LVLLILLLAAEILLLLPLELLLVVGLRLLVLAIEFLRLPRRLGCLSRCLFLALLIRELLLALLILELLLKCGIVIGPGNRRADGCGGERHNEAERRKRAGVIHGWFP
jgi:hypothetical protein